MPYLVHKRTFFRLLLFSLFTMVCAPLWAVDTTWTFDGDGNWNGATNWDNGVPIDATYDVFIDDGDTAVTATLNQSRTIGNLSLGADDALRIEALTSTAVGLTISNGVALHGSILLSGTSSGGSTLTVNNGPLEIREDGLLHFQTGGTGSRTFSGSLLNEGTVQIDHSTFFSRTGSTHSNQGHFTVSSGKTLTLTNNATFEQIAGTLEATGSFSLSTGTFRYIGGIVEGVPSVIGTLEIGSGVTAPFNFLLRDVATFLLVDGVLVEGQTLTMSASTSTTGFTSAEGFTNDGSLLLSGAGTTRLNISNGTLYNSATGLLHFQSGGNRFLNANLINDGIITADRSTTFGKTGGTYVNNNAITVAVTRTLTVSGGGVFEQADGLLKILGTMNVTGSTLRYEGGLIQGTPMLTYSTLVIGPSASAPATFILEGINTFSGEVHSGQVLTIQYSGSTSPDTQGLTTATGFTNNGSIIVIGEGFGDTMQLVVADGVLLNGSTGLLQFQSGEFGSDRKFDGNLINQGTLRIDAPTEFNRLNGVYEQAGGVWNINSELEISRGGEIRLTGGALNLNGDIDNRINEGTLTQTSGTLNYTSGTILGGSYNFLGGTIIGSPRLSQVTLTIGSEATGPISFHLESSNSLVVAQNELLEGLTLSLQGATSSGSITSNLGFTNRGTILFKGIGTTGVKLRINHGQLINEESGLLHFQTGTLNTYQLQSDLINHGTIIVERATIVDRLGGGVLTNNGQLTVAASQSLNVLSSLYQQIGGTTIVNGTLISNTVIQLSGGILSGKGVIAGPMNNASATVAPGDSIGTLTIQNNNFTQQPEGALAIELAGLSPGQFDLLSITGTATLAGTLDVSLLNDFNPNAGDAFQILTATGGVSGMFSMLDLPDLDNDLSWNVLYGPNAVTLAVSLTGDYNLDNTVNAADYVIWRDTNGNPTSYNNWQSHFGFDTGEGSGESLNSAVPEPAAWQLALGLLIAATLYLRRSV